MTERITVDQTGTEIESGLVDEDGSAVSLSNATIPFVRFLQPDGAVVKKNGTIISNVIRYTDDEHYLTQKGIWFYTVGATISGDVNESYQLVRFSVE